MRRLYREDKVTGAGCLIDLAKLGEHDPAELWAELLKIFKDGGAKSGTF